MVGFRDARRQRAALGRCPTALDQDNAVDRDFVQDDERDREAEHRNNVRRREHRGDGAQSDYCVTPSGTELFCRYDSHSSQKREDHRQLKTQTECKDERHDEIEIFADFGLKLYAQSSGRAWCLERGKKTNRIGKHDIKDESRTEQK